MSLIIPANTLASGGYEVANSLRFNDGSSDCLTRSLSSTSTSWTFSAWVKRGSNLGATNYIISWGNSGTDATGIGFNASNTFQYYSESSPDNKHRQTSAKYRDTSAWYHLVVKSNSNAITLYVNGEEPTQSWTTGSSANPLDTSTMQIGKWVTSAYYHDGYMAEVCFIDGTALDPTSFGEFDEDSGIWKPISVSGLTFGTNGFYLDFKDSGALGADVSGNTNNFTVNNLTAIDQSTDTCTNNFATMINASSASKAYTLSEGNLKVTGSANNWYGVPRGSIGVSSGKWYFEVKVTDQNNNLILGYMSASNLADVGDRQVNGFEKVNGLQSSGYIKRQDSSEANIGYTWSDGDIAQIALDMDNKKLWIGKNNSYYNSGNPATGSNETIGSSYFTAGEAYLPITTFYGTNDVSFNFGSPPYSESGGETDGNGYGNFAHAVPANYYSLNSKNLAEYG